MRAPFVSTLGVLAGLVTTAADGAAQRVLVEVGVRAPPVSARVAYGTAGYRTVIHPASAWVTVPHLARLHRAHTAWLAHEHAHLYALRHHHRPYQRALRAFERERVRRERELARAYERWMHEQDRGRRWQHRHE